MHEIGIIIGVGILLWVWQFLNWVWFKPKRLERMFRRQGMKGNPYKFLYGDSQETARMYEEAFKKPLGLHDDIVPRLMPNIYHAVQKYGNFCFTWAGPRPRIFITEPEVAREVLGKNQVFLKTFKVTNHTLQMLVTGLATLEGDEWSKSRGRIIRVFKIDKLRPMVPMVQQCCEETVSKYRELVRMGDGKCVVDVSPDMSLISSGVLSRLMFNCPYTDVVKETFHQLDELANLASLHARIWSIPGEKYFPSKTNRRAHEIDKYVRAAFTTMIQERLEKKKAKSVADNDDGYEDLLDVFMTDLYTGNYSSKDRPKLIEAVVGELRVFFFAGFETTSNLLTWCLVLLSIHPHCQSRAREEILRVIGNKEKLTSEDIAQLKYVTMVINEALRLYPPAMEISRWVSQDTIVKGYKIPKDSLITFPTLMYHRNPDIWGEDAHEFKPERFVDGVSRACKGEVGLMPFGWGPRICIGMNFSLQEAKIFLALMLREFSVELAPTYTHAPSVTFTVQAQYGAPLVLNKL